MPETVHFWPLFDQSTFCTNFQPPNQIFKEYIRLGGGRGKQEEGTGLAMPPTAVQRKGSGQVRLPAQPYQTLQESSSRYRGGGTRLAQKRESAPILGGGTGGA